MLRHRDLLGDELHNAKVSIEPPTRSPDFVGELVFDGTVLWIADGLTAADWQPTVNQPPPAAIAPLFSWSLDLGAIDLGFGNVLSFYYTQDTPEQLNQWTTWTLLRRYTFGTDIPAYGGVVNLNGFLEQRGEGLYMPLMGSGSTAIATALDIAFVNPDEAVKLVNVGRFTEPGTSRIHNAATAFAVSKVQASFIGTVLTPFN